MSEAMQQMNKHRAAMLKSETDAAVLNLAKHLHEHVEPCVTPQTQAVKIFKSPEEFVRVFEADKPVMAAAANRVFAQHITEFNDSQTEEQRKRGYHKYRVVKTLHVQKSEVLPWFDKPGGGIQYLTKKTVKELLKAGYLKEVED